MIIKINVEFKGVFFIFIKEKKILFCEILIVKYNINFGKVL
jgi:hypothetical protein